MLRSNGRVFFIMITDPSQKGHETSVIIMWVVFSSDLMHGRDLIMIQTEHNSRLLHDIEALY